MLDPCSSLFIACIDLSSVCLDAQVGKKPVRVPTISAAFFPACYANSVCHSLAQSHSLNLTDA